jgi:hypothetical protein
MIERKINRNIIDLDTKNRLNDSNINYLYQKILDLPLTNKINLIYNINTIQRESTTETVKQSVIEMQKQLEFYTHDTQLIPINLGSFVYNQWMPLDQITRSVFNLIKFPQLEQSHYLLFSYNLFKYYVETDNELCIIVKLDKYHYLLEHISQLNHYIYMKPIYNLRGNLINKCIFKKDETLILFETVFNYNLQLNNGNIFNLGEIIFDVVSNKETKTIILDDNQSSQLMILIKYSKLLIFNKKYDILYQIKYDTAVLFNSNFYENNVTFMKEIYKHYYENLSNKFTITENSYVKIRSPTEYRIP